MDEFINKTNFEHFSEPPTIQHTNQSDLTFIQDSTVTLPCDVSGDPPPTITWKKNGVYLPEVDPHYFIDERGNLVIFSVDPQDSATYQCKAENEVGVSEKRLTLFVQSTNIIVTMTDDTSSLKYAFTCRFIVPCFFFQFHQR